MKRTNSQQKSRSRSYHSLSSSVKKRKGLLDTQTFRISKINLNSFNEVRMTQPRIRKSLLIDPSPQIEKLQVKLADTRLQRSISNAFQKIKPDLNVTIEDFSPHKKKANLNEKTLLLIQPQSSNPYVNTLDNDMREFRVEPAKTSKRDYGVVKAYAANTHAGAFIETNNDRLSIVMNLSGEGRIKNQPISFFALFDGHNGSSCAQFLRDHFHLYLGKEPSFPDNMPQALANTMKKIEQQYLKGAEKRGESSGSSATIVVITNNKCYTANVGNSRVILSQNYGEKIQQLTVDHSPHTDKEYRRVVRAGGSIYQQKSSSDDGIKYPFRVVPGKLKVTRSIGDYELKSDRHGYRHGIIIADCEVETYDLAQSDFILMASDGVFDSLSNMEVVKGVWSSLLRRRKDTIHQEAGEAINSVIIKALKKMGTDSMSCILICLDNLNKVGFEEQELQLPDVQSAQ